MGKPPSPEGIEAIRQASEKFFQGNYDVESFRIESTIAVPRLLATIDAQQDIIDDLARELYWMERLLSDGFGAVIK